MGKYSDLADMLSNGSLYKVEYSRSYSHTLRPPLFFSELNVTKAKPGEELVEVTGRRIVDIGHIFNFILGDVHGSAGCSFAHNKLIRETRRGFESIWTFECRMCQKRTVLHSEPPPNGTKMHANDAAVSGVIAGGTGYAQLAELCAAMDIPCMTNNTFTAHEKEVSKAICEAAMESMTTAAKEEYRLAEERGDVDAEGHGRIVVVGDGFWPKRSYNCSFSSSTGIVSKIVDMTS